MSADPTTFYSTLARGLRGDQLRSPATLVPAAFAFLWELKRFLVAYGGRASAKSWSISRVLLVLAHETPLRILCAREIQGSIKESAYRLLVDQIELLALSDFYDIQSDRILGSNGTVFYFEGLRFNSSKIRSYEGVDIVWVEEAQNVSDLSWETLLPTIRKAGSRFFISFNPMTRDDPVSKRFVESARPDVIAKKVTWRDNPFLSPEAEAERVWLERTDPDAYRHVWEGEPRTVSDALILKGKYTIETFEVQPAWAGPYHGLDYGFSRDPSAALRCYIDDTTRTLYASHEFWALGADIDALPGALESAIPGISQHVVYADSARPESTSYLQRNGIANARSAEKWPGSVDDGIAYLRSFTRIVVDPSCRHLIDECGTYSFKSDRLTGVPLPEPVDANNHLIDALRYALSPLIRNLPAGGFFSRPAFLVNGEAVEPGERPTRLLATVASCERSGAVGLVYWAYQPHHGVPLRALDYELVEVAEALDREWLGRVFARAEELRAEWNAVDPIVRLWAEAGQLHEALRAGLAPHMTGQRNLIAVESRRLVSAQKLPLVTLDERCAELRAAVNGGGLVKLARAAYTRQTTHRSITANHLLSQLLGYRPAAPDAARALMSAFALGCLIGRGRGSAQPVTTPPRPTAPGEQWSPHDFSNPQPWTGFPVA